MKEGGGGGVRVVTGVNHAQAGNTKRQGGAATERSTESADGGDADAFKMHEMQQEARRRGGEGGGGGCLHAEEQRRDVLTLASPT